ncbi:MAG TPA: hypothetical protein PKA28_12365 [Methylomusa anaerophila]|uniref:hypothetical protein n=1 Tax=Methylomusa anaerophila TaxID=1930071 RepID=UPI0011AE2D06|nr:hypothetical protein [Methylomusa anaerophila]HML89226.1 hypothetical protein [Methylomusa anaerophila]
MCSGKGFDEKDFADFEKPIEAELEIRLLPSEQGFFDDNFSPDDKISWIEPLASCMPFKRSPNISGVLSHKREDI